MRNYLIIGGTSGIGAAISKTLENENKLFIGSKRINEPELVNHKSYFAYDSTKDLLPLDLLPDRLDGLVYCPGTINLKPIHQLKTEDFEKDLAINLTGAFRTIQQALPLLKKTETGAAIILFSTVAVTRGMPYHSSIAAAKGGIEGLTRALAAELAPKIRVNAIAPSLTDTPLAQSLLNTDAKKQNNAERHPLKRVGQDSDIAGMASFLLDPDNSWISGQIFHIDGGLSALNTK